MIRVLRNIRSTTPAGQPSTVKGPIFAFRLVPQEFPYSPTILGAYVNHANEDPGEYPARVELVDARGFMQIVDVFDAGWIPLASPARSIRVLAPAGRWAQSANEWWALQYAIAPVPLVAPPASRLYALLYAREVADATVIGYVGRTRHYRAIWAFVKNYAAAAADLHIQGQQDALAGTAAMITTYDKTISVPSALPTPKGIVVAPDAGLNGLLAAFNERPPLLTNISFSSANGGILWVYGEREF